jgi:hypothetical protein
MSDLSPECAPKRPSDHSKPQSVAFDFELEDQPKAARPCPHRNTSFVPLTEQHFGLVRRLARCKFVKDRGGAHSVNKQFEEPGGFPPQSANALRDIFCNQPPEVRGVVRQREN